MNDGIEVIFGENFVDFGLIAEVDTVKNGFDAGNFLDGIKNGDFTIEKVVDDDNFLAGVDKFNYGVRADIA